MVVMNDTITGDTMKNTNYVMNFLEGIGLDVEIERGVLGKEGYTHEGTPDNATGEWIGVSGLGIKGGQKFEVSVVIFQDFVKGEDKIESGSFDQYCNTYDLYKKDSYRLEDLEFIYTPE